VLNTATNTKTFEYDLRPYHTSGASGVAGGEAPFTVAVKGTGAGAEAYVSSIRDREVVVVNIGGSSGSLVTRIPLPGNPNSLLLNANQTRLYVTQDNSDTVAVIDTGSNTVIEEISTIAPPGTVPSGTRYTGAAANNLALSPDGETLYVTNGAANSVAIIPLAGAAPHSVAGLVPTAWYPNAVSLSADGAVMYVVNGKSDPGANPNYLDANGNNEYVEQLEGSDLAVVPVPASADLGHLTAQVAANNGYSVAASANDAAVMAALRTKIQHIIYIIKENRTYDQILGDLANGGNGDPALAEYGKRVTPNFHLLSQNFVTLDNFFCSGEVSGNGWAWSTEGRESDHGTKTIPPNYAGRGASNDSEGANRDVNVGIASLAGRNQALNNLYSVVASPLTGGAANLLPGTNNDFATDGPGGVPKQTGYIWDAALRAGLTVRDYGFFIDLSRYQLPKSVGGLQPADYAAYDYLRNPYALGLNVAISTNPTLSPYTDPYFRGFDNAFPDVWRVEEWQREFAQYDRNKNLPNLTLLRLMHDHTGNFGGSSPAVAGLNTPELQQADNDLAVGRVVATLAQSHNYAGNTLIMVLEDDAQAGPDHMDAHRSTAYVVGPYVKHNAVVSTRYSTVNMVRTIEDILGLDHLGLNDAYQRPMTDVFDLTQASWTYSPIASPYLASTQIAALDPTIRFAEGPAAMPTRTPEYWAEATRGFDWSAADRVPAELFNRVQWEGLMPGRPYPTLRSGEDLRRRVVTDAAARRD
jgi:YVTN family beta-propeller protein